MTVSSTTTKVSYSGNGSTTVFAYTFKIFADADLTVIVRTDSTGAEVTKTLTTDYTVSGAGNVSGGNVTFVTAPASGETVVIKRNLALTQPTDYTPNDPFPAASHEDALDRQMFVAQQQEERFDRALVFPETDTASTTIPNSVTRADKFLGFDSSGNVTALSSTGVTPGAVGTGELEDNAVTTAKLASNSVTSAKIVDGTIATADIADSAITNAKMADDSVGSAEIIDNSVTAAELNISGNGTVGQYLVSDGDGSFSYKTPATPTVQVFTSSGTWTKPTDCKKVKVTVVGGGGGGGAARGSSAGTARSTGGGGGGASIKFIDVTSISSETVTVGAGGAGGALTAQNGSTGGTSSFGSHCSATGGIGGNGADNTIVSANGVFGGEGSGGDINIKGTPPKATYTPNGGIIVGIGGDSIFGGGATPRIYSVPATSIQVDTSGATLGGGAGGHAQDDGSQGGRTGGDGIVIVEEYY